MEVSNTTLSDLDWPALLDALAQSAKSDLGKAAARALRFSDDAQALNDLYAETDEALLVLREQRRPALSELFDIEQEIRAAERQAAVPGLGLLNVAAICQTLLGLRGEAHAAFDKAPRLRARATSIADLRPLVHRLQHSIDARGELTDDASPELKSLRARALSLHDELVGELDAMLVGYDQAGLLSERFVALRNDRFVVPIKASEQGRVPGIIHDASHTGHTVFVEPEVVVERGNRLKWLRAEIGNEERRVLRVLSEEVARNATGIRHGLAEAVHIDVLFARADLARRLSAVPPQLIASGSRLVLTDARHPLLVLKTSGIIGNDLHFADGEQCLVLTGPNTGGKTAALKTMGLSVLMARAGLFVPAARADIPMLHAVHSVIGDNQSITQALSTFSYHIKEIERVLESLQPATARAALVLFDELCADTDPRLGAALGRAILEALAALPAQVVVTTHYQELAALGALDKRFATAAFGFDFKNLRPTYKLVRGSLGQSNPLEIALQLGLDKDIVARARAIAGDMHSAHEALIEELHKQKDAMTHSALDAEADRQAAAVARSEAEAELARTIREREAAAGKATQLLSEDLKVAQERVRQTVRKLQEGQAQDTRAAFAAANEARAAINEAEETIRSRFPKVAEEPATHLRVGQSVRARGLVGEAVGEIVAIDEQRQEAVVALGALRLRQPLSDLQPARGAQKPVKPRPKTPTPRQEPAATPNGDRTRVDVRGETVDEAVRDIERALDDALKEQRPEVTILHGHGTGVLKNAIREYLSYSHYVRSYRPGTDHEGKDAVTIVNL